MSAANVPVCHDANGFVVPELLVAKYRSLQARPSSRTAAAFSWPELLEQARRKQYRSGGPLPPKFVAAVRDGVPSEFRAEAWMLLSGARQRMDAQPHLYKHLLGAAAAAKGQPKQQSVEDAIDLDVRRTFPDNPRLTAEFVATLRRVLLAYARRNPEVGYCQGMNFVAASVLLFIAEEEAAFWLLSHLVETVLPDHFVQSMIGHTIDRQVSEELVEQHLPQLTDHLRELSLSMPFVTTHWFLCLFVTSLPSETAFRLWDLIICLEPTWLFRATLALFATMEAQSLLEASVPALCPSSVVCQQCSVPAVCQQCSVPALCQQCSVPAV